jgi:MOSC domain-containing protein YiiM
MDAVARATLVEGQGVAGSVGRSTRRQVTLIERENWDQCMRDLERSADPKGRRANIMLSGIRLARTRGKVLVVGKTRLAIGGELTPCERMDEVVPGLQTAMKADWRGGVFAQVVEGGEIAIGDLVEWADPNQ